ncbi:MAG: hypothetical protein Q8J89_11630 [Caulobacter sp.]|nr:hypothetical protein [Caulobacter sp.]
MLTDSGDWETVRAPVPSENRNQALRTFSFYIHDRRYSVPTLQIVTVRDEGRARELAQQRLDEGEHHLAVEVVEGQDELFRLERQDA